MLEQKYIIHQDQSLLEALTQINALQQGPLVLFVVDDEERMVGTLTDGDARRALIAGANVKEKTQTAMHTNFNFIREGEGDIVAQLHRQRELHMRLVPILDQNNNISDIINLEEFITKLPIDAVLMAGGKGERLRPLTENTPKPLLPVGGKAIIDHNIDRLISYGVQHISVTVNYLKEQIEEHFAQSHNGVQVQTVREPKFLGTIGGLQFVPKFFHDTVLLMNSDLFTNVNFEDFFLHFEEHQADMSAVAIPYSISVPYGIFSIENKREIQGILEKPTYNYYANAGIYLIRKEMLDKYIPKDSFYNATDFMEKLISEGRKVIRFPLTGYWIDIGNKQEYQKAQDLVKHL
jgi:dTDP-glucose pyrophosphorylase